MKSLFIKEGDTKIDKETQQQLSFPKGKFGTQIGKKLFKSNADVIDKCLEQIDFNIDSKICDVGCGPGYAIQEMCKRLDKGEVIGIDPSAIMRDQARKHNKIDVETGKVKIINAATPKLPLKHNYFDYVLLINVIYFWKNIDIHLRELHRILKSGGKLIIYLTDKSSLLKKIRETDGIYNMYSKENIISTLLNTGFFKKNIHSFSFTRKSGEKGIIISARS